MKTKVLVGALIFLIVLNLATLGTWLYLRFISPPERASFMAGGPPAIMRDLEPETRVKLHELMLEFRSSIIVLQSDVQMAEDSVATLLQQDPVPTPLIYQTIQRVAELRASISKRAVDHLVKTKTILTPEQQKLFFRAIIEAQPRMRGGNMIDHVMGFGPGSQPRRPGQRHDPKELDPQPHP